MHIAVTPRAEKQFNLIVNYIKLKWGELAARQFIERTDGVFKLLKRYPSMGQIERGEIRGLLLSSQTRILYRINNKRIIILAFFDVRQDPDKKYQ